MVSYKPHSAIGALAEIESNADSSALLYLKILFLVFPKYEFVVFNFEAQLVL